MHAMPSDPMSACRRVIRRVRRRVQGEPGGYCGTGRRCCCFGGDECRVVVVVEEKEGERRHVIGVL